MYEVTEQECNGTTRMFYKWGDDSLDKLKNSQCFEHFENFLKSGDIDGAVEAFSSLIQNSCERRKRRAKSKTNNSNADWWDEEMDDLKYQKYKCLRTLRTETNECNLIKYRAIRKLYKRKIKEKRFNMMNVNRKKVESCTSASEFWKFIKSKNKSKTCCNKISSNEWKVYFEQLLNINRVTDLEFENEVKQYVMWHDSNCGDCMNEGMNDDENDQLNRLFTMNEIEDAIDELVSGKSPGLDGISNEILKKASVIIVPLLYRLFNCALEHKYFPEQWSVALIIPIHKAGPVNDPNNYRGISLLSCVGKLFTKLICKRLTHWAAENDGISDVQGGFVKGKSTIDQIFIFQSMVSKYLSRRNGRFYSVYVDFSKAFDSVPHLQLFYHLLKSGIHGKLICVVRDMYSKLSSCVQSSSGTISELFTCGTGTRQGCMISPFLFICYIDELVKQATSNNCKGVFIDENYSDINMLLYADDVVIVGDRIGHIQRLLDNLAEYCLKWGLRVNMDKTKFMVFRNGGILKNNEKVYYNGSRIQPCTYYKYLGVVMSTRLSWTPAQKNLSQQAEKCMSIVSKLNYECNFSYSTSKEVFDKCILPVVLYGSEIWGTKAHNCIENVLYKFCRQQLGVGSKSPAPALRGECGQYSLYTYCYIRCIKYWAKLVHLDSNNLLKSCYDMLFRQCQAGRSNWASDIKNILYRFGFGYIWEAQSLDDRNDFFSKFRQRVLDCNIQEWQEKMVEMSKLRTLSLFKTNFCPESYLCLHIPYRLRSSLAKLRIGNHVLEIEQGRHQNLPVNQRICKLCASIDENYVEDEYHVILQCPFYDELRTIYLDIKQKPVNLHTFISTMSAQNNELVMLASFVGNMFKVRRNLLSAL